MDPSAAGAGATRRRAEQYLSVAEKLLVARDLEGCKQFSSQALAADPNTPGAEDLHAASSVLLAAERRRLPNGIPDPYAVLGLDPAIPASRHPDAIHSHYGRLSFLLNRSRPDRPYSFAFTNAARLVADALRLLSDPVHKPALDADLAAAAAAAAARACQSPAPNRPQPQSPFPARPNPPFSTPSPRPTPPPAAPPPRPAPPPAAPPPRPTPPPAAPSPHSTPPSASPAPRPTPPPVACPPRPQPPAAAPSPRPTPPRAALAPRQTQQSASPAPRPIPRPVACPPWPTPPPAVSPPGPTPPAAGPQARPTPPAPAPQMPAAAMAPSAASGTPPSSSSTFWTVCSACRHIHQYDRSYEMHKLLCPSCRQSFVAEAMAEPPPIVPGTDMYYCTWGFFPVGFPGCPGFERLVNSQPQEPDQLNAPWLRSTAGVKGNTGDAGVKGNGENGVPISATTPPAKPMRVKVGAKKRGRPKGSKNKNK